MRIDPFGNRGQQQGGRRRGFGLGGVRWWILLLFAGYAAYYWFSNQTVDPYTGEKALIDKNLSVEDEEALGLQAYQEILSQEPAVDPNSDIAQQVRASWRLGADADTTNARMGFRVVRDL